MGGEELSFNFYHHSGEYQHQEVHTSLSILCE